MPFPRAIGIWLISVTGDMRRDQSSDTLLTHKCGRSPFCFSLEYQDLRLETFCSDSILYTSLLAVLVSIHLQYALILVTVVDKPLFTVAESRRPKC